MLTVSGNQLSNALTTFIAKLCYALTDLWLIAEQHAHGLWPNQLSSTHGTLAPIHVLLIAETVCSATSWPNRKAGMLMSSIAERHAHAVSPETDPSSLIQQNTAYDRKSAHRRIASQAPQRTGLSAPGWKSPHAADTSDGSSRAPLQLSAAGRPMTRLPRSWRPPPVTPTNGAIGCISTKRGIDRRHEEKAKATAETEEQPPGALKGTVSQTSKDPARTAPTATAQKASQHTQASG
jgi:hypothetical protein